MKKLGTFFGVVALMFALGTISTSGAQSACATGQSPCGCEPGQTQTPPCAYVQQTTDSETEPVQTQAAAVSDTVDLTSVVEEALIALLLI